MSYEIWEGRYLGWKEGPRANKPSLFAEQAIAYFPKSGKLLELGAGVGRDSRFFAERGYEVTSTDFSDTALRLNAGKIHPDARQRITLQKVDMRAGLPFPSQSFDIVYAHLSLHYFDRATTLKIMGEIWRVLRYKGVLAFLANSINDPEYGSGPKIEEDFFEIGEQRDAVAKRYFSVESAAQFTHGFDAILLDDLGEAYGKNDSGVHNLIRFVGTKGDAQRDRVL